MTTIRSSFTPVLSLLIIALVGGTAIASTVGKKSCTSPAAVSLHQATASPTAISADYLSDRATLLQAALHSSDHAAAERTLARRSPAFASADAQGPDSEQFKL